MMLENDSNLLMICEKTSSDNYSVYIADNVNNSITTMYYTNKSDFPHQMNTSSGNELLRGILSPHRKDRENFDIRWYDEQNNDETINDIPLKKDIYSHTKYQGVNDQTDYQIKIIKISLKILDALSSYSLTIK